MSTFLTNCKLLIYIYIYTYTIRIKRFIIYNTFILKFTLWILSLFVSRFCFKSCTKIWKHSWLQCSVRSISKLTFIDSVTWLLYINLWTSVYPKLNSCNEIFQLRFHTNKLGCQVHRFYLYYLNKAIDGRDMWMQTGHSKYSLSCTCSQRHGLCMPAKTSEPFPWNTYKKLKQQFSRSCTLQEQCSLSTKDDASKVCVCISECVCVSVLRWHLYFSFFSFYFLLINITHYYVSNIWIKPPPSPTWIICVCAR